MFLAYATTRKVESSIIDYTEFIINYDLEAYSAPNINKYKIFQGVEHGRHAELTATPMNRSSPKCGILDPMGSAAHWGVLTDRVTRF
jgi:hypothetical protein